MLRSLVGSEMCIRDRYNASSQSKYPSDDFASLVNVNLLVAASQALKGLRGCKLSETEMDHLVKIVDDSEHHPGWVSQSSFVKGALRSLPSGDNDFQSVIMHLSDALAWIQFQTITEVVIGVHADTCGADCKHLPGELCSRLPNKPKSSTAEESPRESGKPKTIRGRTRRLERLFQSCDVQKENLLKTEFLMSLGQVTMTLGHRTIHSYIDSERHVWSDEIYNDAVSYLDSLCKGEVTEAKFVQVFEERLPVDEDIFESVMNQLEAAAKHLRNVEYATEFNNHRHHQQMEEQELQERQPGNGRGGGGCTRSGCVSACAMM
eukprot:TRINITY_DN18213_c0_g1_i10.p1 TRINITY_DN18213_c0_g1~~TRINITY_DN18213_c0_g1_i10.p1  ORF type:complete len:320 (-),score=70.42 TRINITY_DN18213_c0_g1_i10:335-1294(-)